MIVSRTLARRRIAAGVVPGRLAAWGAVAADCAIVVALGIALFLWAFPAMESRGLSPLGIGLLAFVGIYVPGHAALVVSSIWAVRSRWRDDD